MKHLLLLLTLVLATSTASADTATDSSRARKSMDAVLRETREALDSALSFFRSPKFDSLKIELRQLAQDSKKLARELRFSADSISRMIEPYMDSIRPYIDSLTDIGEDLEHSFEESHRFSFKELPKGFLEGNIYGLPKGNLYSIPDKEMFKWHERPEGLFEDFDDEMLDDELLEDEEMEEREWMDELRENPPALPKGHRAPQVNPPLQYYQFPQQPRMDRGAPIPRYPGWKIQPLTPGI